jgi:hypothetical protein
VNVEWAATQLSVFIEMTVSKNGSGNGYITTQSFAVRPRDEVLRQWVTVEAILDRVYPEWASRHGGSTNYEFRGRRDAAIYALSLLEAQEEIEANLGGQGPSLKSTSLHPWVWESARPLWGDGHHRAAVQQAATAVDIHLQALVDRRDISGVDLVRQVFSQDPPVEGKPRLRFPDLVNEETTRSVRSGVKSLGEACFAAIRNPSSHSTEDLSEAEALEQLAVLSYFCRLVAMCDVKRVE